MIFAIIITLSLSIYDHAYMCVYIFTIHGYSMSSQHNQLLVGLIAQLAEHCTIITEVILRAGILNFQAA